REIGFEYFVPIWALHSHYELVPRDSCVVHQDVNLAKGLDRSLDPRLDFVVIGDVHAKSLRLAALGNDLALDLLQFLFIAGRKRNSSPISCQFEGTCSANALRCSCN